MSRVVDCRACGRFFDAHSHEEAVGRLCLACRAEGVRALRAVLLALLLAGCALLVTLALVSMAGGR